MTELAFSTHGNPASPPVALLHGFMSCAAQWWPNLDALSERYFLVNIELWGHGESPEPDAIEDYSVDGYMRALDAIRETLGITSWLMVGQSYGAGVALNYALHRPSHCGGVVATNSRSAFGSLNAETATASPFDRADFSARRLPYHPIHARRFPDQVKDALVRCADDMPVNAIRNGGRLGADLNFRTRLHLIEQPLLLTNGVFERSFQSDLAVLKERYPDLNVVDLPAGHSVNIEAPDEFNAACLEFFDAITTGSQP